MAKKKRKGYLAKYHTKERRQYIDYDYANKLNEEEKEWLSRFTDEEYGASFELDPIFMLLSDIPEEFQEKIQDNTLYENKYVMVHGNEEKGQNNIDMRKMRPYTQYYLDEAGDFTSDKKYRYSSNNINDPTSIINRKRCNRRVRDMRNDLVSMGLRESINPQAEAQNHTNLGHTVTQHHKIDDHNYVPSHEDIMILQEEIDIIDDLFEKGLIDDPRKETKT